MGNCHVINNSGCVHTSNLKPPSIATSKSRGSESTVVSTWRRMPGKREAVRSGRTRGRANGKTTAQEGPRPLLTVRVYGRNAPPSM